MGCFVFLRYNIELKSSSESFGLIGTLAKEVPKIITRGCQSKWRRYFPQDSLHASEVEVCVQPTGPFDQNIQDFNVIIWANTKASEDLEEWKENIVEALEKLLPDHYSFCVKIFLAPSAVAALEPAIADETVTALQ